MAYFHIITFIIKCYNMPYRFLHTTKWSINQLMNLVISVHMNFVISVYIERLEADMKTL